ncbi:MAG: hypothetical protein ACK5QH_19095 [Rubrivivax sp.]
MTFQPQDEYGIWLTEISQVSKPSLRMRGEFRLLAYRRAKLPHILPLSKSADRGEQNSSDWMQAAIQNNLLHQRKILHREPPANGVMSGQCSINLTFFQEIAKQENNVTNLYRATEMLKNRAKKVRRNRMIEALCDLNSFQEAPIIIDSLRLCKPLNILEASAGPEGRQGAVILRPII